MNCIKLPYEAAFDPIESSELISLISAVVMGLWLFVQYNTMVYHEGMKFN